MMLSKVLNEDQSSVDQFNEGYDVRILMKIFTLGIAQLMKTLFFDQKVRVFDYHIHMLIYKN